jgi:hypothetical protein
MAVPITIIQGSDNVALSRLTMNANFTALKAASDAVTALLNPQLFTLSGVKSVVIDDSAQALSTSILTVTKGASILGNLTFGTIAANTSVVINGVGGVSISESSLSIPLGNLTVGSGATASSLLTAGGNFQLNGQFRSPGLASSQSSMISLTSTATYNITPTAVNNKYVFVSNGSTSSLSPFGLTVSLGAGATGQMIEIYHILGPSGPVRIDTTNFIGATGIGLTGPIILTRSGDKIKCLYEAPGWYLWDVEPAYMYGATSSISYTRK